MLNGGGDLTGMELANPMDQGIEPQKQSTF